MLAHSGAFRYSRGAQKGPFGLKQGLTGRKAPGGRFMTRFGPYCLTGLQSWLPHTLAWCWDSSWPHRSPKRTPFGGPGGPPRARRGQIWSQLLPIVLTGLESFLAPRDQKRASFWPKMPLLGCLKVLGGPEGTRFGPKTPGLLCMGWYHSYN